MKVTHPARTRTQRRILDNIGSGDYSPSARRQTLDNMVQEGLIVRLADRVLGHDVFGPITIPQYEMPTPVHMQWCSYWASKTTEEIT